MQMPVIVGVIVGIIVLISFTGWFYHVAKGWEEYVLDDVYFWYRIGGATIFSITIMTLTFFTMAYLYECPSVASAESNEDESRLAKNLNCPAYEKIKTTGEDFFRKLPARKAPIEEPTEVDFESMTEEI